MPEGRYFERAWRPAAESSAFTSKAGATRYPYRVKFRSPGLPLVSVVDYLVRGSKIADLIAIGGSLDYVVPDIDR